MHPELVAFAGAWLLDETSYYTQGTFMTVNNNVHSFIASLQQVAEGTISLLHMQLLAAAYQHAVLRDAYALAKALGRILILPPVYSWCDWDPSPDVLGTCVTVDNEGQVPYEGPSDLYVNIEVRCCSPCIAALFPTSACRDQFSDRQLCTAPIDMAHIVADSAVALPT
jgi:hypothetical protein